MTGKTAIIIAHRLHTLSEMDKILVMDEGKVVEYGAPSVLLANPDSLYSKLLGEEQRMYII